MKIYYVLCTGYVNILMIMFMLWIIVLDYKMYDNISLIIWLILIVILTIMNLFQSNYDIRYWVMFTLLTIFLQYIHCYDSTSFFCFVLLTCYVQVMSFCSRLCSNYEMHSLLQIHKSGRVTPVLFVYSSGPSRGPGRGVRAVSARWSWDATKATKSWCKIAVGWEREKVAKDAVARIGTAQIPVSCVS